MAVEIERKFLVKEGWQPKNAGVRIAQGYLSSVPERTVRVRIKGEKGYLTVKGKNQGISRAEFEYEIPVADAEAMLKLCEQPPVEKTRYLEKYEGHTWEIDIFAGANKGLRVAEIELPSEDTDFLKPAWAGMEVSGDARYYNSSLSLHPYQQWAAD
ncbi:CYTH domain-containing protein [Mitsuokella sp.]|uniref:CYTH domain-containing protein n=1 Tax=Mitsuokella sp. TaxID=2049034 RepID=UPI003D7D53CA